MNCPTNETLEQLALGFLEDPAAVSSHVAGCAACGRAMDALKADHEAIAGAARDIRLPALRPPAPRRRLWKIVAASAACLLAGLAALMIFVPSATERHVEGDPSAREYLDGVRARSLSGRVSRTIKGEETSAAIPAETTYRAFDGSKNDTLERIVVAPPVTPAPAPVPEPPAPGMYFKDYPVNPVVETSKETQSTFALDVDTASYSLIRNYLRRGGFPPAQAVRVEECLNYFRYNDAPPPDRDFAVRLEVAPSPYAEGRHLLRVAILARELRNRERKDAVLTFVIDVSGSMAQENRLGLVKRSLRFLVETLRPTDRIGIVVYGSYAKKLLDPTAVARKDVILGIIDELRTEGSTNAEAGLLEGYRMADAGFDATCTNRVVLCSDGVANVGNTGPEAILSTISDHAAKGVTLSTLGFGMGNYNDVLMEQLADKGNGNYAYIDDFDEAKKIFSEKLTGMLEVVAADAKVQVEFDAKTVASFRLLGYENRHVANKDFRNDKVDAGEVGAGHRVNALYEVVLKKDEAGRLATVRLRYRDPENREVPEHQESISVGQVTAKPSASWRLAAAVGQFAEILRGTAKEGTMAKVLEQAEPAVVDLDRPQDAVEFLDLVKLARALGR